MWKSLHVAAYCSLLGHTHWLPLQCRLKNKWPLYRKQQSVPQQLSVVSITGSITQRLDGITLREVATRAGDCIKQEALPRSNASQPEGSSLCTSHTTASNPLQVAKTACHFILYWLGRKPIKPCPFSHQRLANGPMSQIWQITYFMSQVLLVHNHPPIYFRGVNRCFQASMGESGSQSQQTIGAWNMYCLSLDRKSWPTLFTGKYILNMWRGGGFFQN